MTPFKATDESDPKSGESGTKAKMTKISVQYTQPFDPAMIGTSSRQLFSQEQVGEFKYFHGLIRAHSAGFSSYPSLHC